MFFFLHQDSGCHLYGTLGKVLFLLVNRMWTCLYNSFVWFDKLDWKQLQSAYMWLQTIYSVVNFLSMLTMNLHKKFKIKRLLWRLNSQSTDYLSAIIAITLRVQLWVVDTERLSTNFIHVGLVLFELSEFISLNKSNTKFGKHGDKISNPTKKIASNIRAYDHLLNTRHWEVLWWKRRRSFYRTFHFSQILIRPQSSPCLSVFWCNVIPQELLGHH